jgi:hypothetical protein
MTAILGRNLGVSEEVQVAGYDATYWDIVHDPMPAALPTTNGEPAVLTDGESPPTDVRTTPPAV